MAMDEMNSEAEKEKESGAAIGWKKQMKMNPAHSASSDLLTDQVAWQPIFCPAPAPALFFLIQTWLYRLVSWSCCRN